MNKRVIQKETTNEITLTFEGFETWKEVDNWFEEPWNEHWMKSTFHWDGMNLILSKKELLGT